MLSTKERKQKIEAELKKHDAKRLLIEAKLKALQHACPHTNAKGHTHYDYGGGSDYYWNCPDCGLNKVT